MYLLELKLSWLDFAKTLNITSMHLKSLLVANNDKHDRFEYTMSRKVDKLLIHNNNWFKHISSEEKSVKKFSS